MTKDEEEAIQADNAHFMDAQQQSQIEDVLWVLSVTMTAAGMLLGMFIWEVVNL